MANKHRQKVEKDTANELHLSHQCILTSPRHLIELVLCNS